MPASNFPDLMQDRGPATMDAQVERDPMAATQAAEQAAQRAKSTVGNKDDNMGEIGQLNSQLGITGKTIAEARKQALEGLKRANVSGKIDDQQYGELKDKWKGIFNYISRDEMGLFLIDFGLRAMMAGETMGDLGALGAAGSGALGALQGRRQAAAQQENALAAQANEQALAEYGAETDRVSALAQMTSAEARSRQVDQTGRGYAGEKVWLTDFFRNAGWSDQEIANYFAKAQNPAARRQALTDALLKRIEDAGFTDEDPNLGKAYREFDANDIQDWVDIMLELENERISAEAGGGPALGGGEQPPPVGGGARSLDDY
jgi:hypothetical protein